MTILRLLMLCMMTASAFAASEGFERFEGPLNLTLETGGHTYSMVRFDPTNTEHMAAAQQFETESFPDCLVKLTYRAMHYGPLGYYQLETPFTDYLFFKDGKCIGTCELPDPFEDSYGKLESKISEALTEGIIQSPAPELLTEGIMQPPALEPKRKHLHPETDAFFLEAVAKNPSLYQVASGFDFKARNILSIYLTPSARGGIGKIFIDMVRHLFVDPMLGKTVLVPKLDEERFTEAQSASPFLGYMGEISYANVPSLGSQLASKEVGVAIGCLFPGSVDCDVFHWNVCYPPAEDNSPATLTVAQGVVAMEKAHRAAASADTASATASGSGGALSA